MPSSQQQPTILPLKEAGYVQPTLGQVLNAERKLDRQALIERALANVEKVPVIYGETEPFC